jgi:hypothetical protein
VKRYDRVKEILDSSVNGEAIGAHGAFWRTLDLETFKTKKVYGRRLVEPGNGPSSNLVLALRGQAPFGNDVGTPGASLPRMPARRPAVPEGQIAFVETWIADGCPDDEA